MLASLIHFTKLKSVVVAMFTFGILVALLVWTTAPHSSVAQTGDYDSDDDGLIEISALEQLNAVRWDLNGNGAPDSQANQDAYAAAFPNAPSDMGCPNSGCDGYELARDLDFDDPSSYASGVVNPKWTEGTGWLPIGLANPFRTTFNGNDHTIANLYINRSGLTDPGVVGLFGENRGHISRIGLIDVDVTGDENVGGLVGYNTGEINDTYATGDISGDERVGGLVGYNHGTIRSSNTASNVSGDERIGGLVGSNSGTISASHTTRNVSGRTSYAGGLIGRNDGTIIASYATGDVSGSSNVGGLTGSNYNTIRESYAMGNVFGSGYAAGGLVGHSQGEDVIIATSYSTGDVSGNEAVGGLVGLNESDAVIYSSYTTGNISGNISVGGLIGILLGRNPSVINASYWNTQTTEQSSGVGRYQNNTPFIEVAGKTTAELQAPTGYTGIYAEWLIDLDNADRDFDITTGVDDYWDFGTSSQYPALKADIDGDGIATWQEFGSQRVHDSTASPLPTPVPTIPTPVPALRADLELTMMLSDYLGFLWYYLIVENNGPSEATGIVLTDDFPEGVSPILSAPVEGTCSGDKTVTCELGSLDVGSKNLVMIVARLDDTLSQSVPVNAASVIAAESDPRPANNEASR